MEEIGINSVELKTILDGTKTIEGRLGKPRFIKLRVGDKLSLREDEWQDDKIINEIHDVAAIEITQLLYFETFREMLDTFGYKIVFPKVSSIEEALKKYKKFYSAEDEEEYGVVAIRFKLI